MATIAEDDAFAAAVLQAASTGQEHVIDTHTASDAGSAAATHPWHVTMHCRVLRKHAFSRELLFLDVVYADPQYNSDFVEFRGSYSPPQGPHYEFASVVLKREKESVCEPVSENMSALQTSPGDTLSVRAVVQNLDDFCGAHRERPSLFARPCDVSVTHKWCAQTHGVFSFHTDALALAECPSWSTSTSHNIADQLRPDVYTENAREASFARCGSLVFASPSLAIQCKTTMVARVLPLLREIVKDCDREGERDGEKRVRGCVRESLSSLAKSSDRLLLVWARCETHTLIERLTHDRVLSSAIMRVYTGLSASSANMFVAHASLDYALSSLVAHTQDTLSAQQKEEIARVRLLAYPKSISSYVIDQSLPIGTQTHTQTLTQTESRPLLPWSPQRPTHCLSLCLTDGLWMLSLVPQSEAFVGDLREKPLSTQTQTQREESAEGKGENTGTSTVICRAQAKMEEALRRRNWLYQPHTNGDIEGNITHKYRFAIDVGASPGGWTFFLAQHSSVQRILAVDKGLLQLPTPWPTNVTHWEMLGNEALDCLVKEREEAQTGDNVALNVPREIDLYCCDANIPPAVSCDLLLRCVRESLLSVGARVVLTLKNTLRRKNEWEQTVSECVCRLTENGFAQLEVVHLLANTQRETTVLAVYQPTA